MRAKFLRVLYATLLVVAAVALLPGQSQATWFDLTTSNPLVNDYIDWAQLGPTTTVLPNTVTVQTGVFGHSLTLSSADSLERLDQGNGWAGNFANGAAFIWTGANQMTLNFGSTNPLFIFETQIQADYYGPFTATIEAYDINGTLLHSFSENGVSNGNGDNSAILIGLADSLKEMTNIRLIVTGTDPHPADFAINRVDLLECNTSPVPLPALRPPAGQRFAWPSGLGRSRKS